MSKTLSKTPFDRQLYELYQYMLKRCYRSTNPHFNRYGGRGIKVCERWLPQARGVGYRNFLADMGPRPKGYSLDRIDYDGDYTPKNCRWIPWPEQHKNRHNNVWIEFMGVRLIAKDWARATGVRDDVITKRLRRGIPKEIALFDTGNLHERDTAAMIEAAAAKKRSQTHCKRGHPLSGDNLYIQRTGKWPARVCRTCKREAVARYRKS